MMAKELLAVAVVLISMGSLHGQAWDSKISNGMELPPSEWLPKLHFNLYRKDMGQTTERYYLSEDFAVTEDMAPLDTTIKILVHGFLQNSGADNFNAMKDAYLNELYPNKVTVFLMSWEHLHDTEDPLLADYFFAYKNIDECSYAITKIIDSLQTIGHSLDNIHLVGFSLGGHVVGHCGDKYYKGQLGRVTGLDVAGFRFQQNPFLNQGSAQFVEDYSTAMGSPHSMVTPGGHFNYFPDYGFIPQGDCIDDLCAHSASVFFFTESILYPEKYQYRKCEMDKTLFRTALKYWRGECGDEILTRSGEGVDVSLGVDGEYQLWFNNGNYEV